MQIDNFFKKHALPLTGKTLVVAVSGGPDSLALLDLLYELKSRYQFKLIAAHLDHKLRSDSFKEENVIAKYSQGKDIKVVNGYWPPKEHPNVGIEAAARKYRYHFLVQVLQENHGDYLLTAHHVDDLLENILLKFIRSGNPGEMNSLQAISSVNGFTLLRPLLTKKKADLLLYDQKKGIQYVIDQTNNDDDTLRNRLRHHVVPLLKQENPQITENAIRFNEQVSLLTELASQNFARIKRPEKYLGFTYRLRKDGLKELTQGEQAAFWQNFIWETWHQRVNKYLANYTLLSYQDYFYLFKDLPALPTSKKVYLDHVFAFGQRHFFLSLTEHLSHRLIGKFFAPASANFSVGSIKTGTKLLLKNGDHVKSKKKFAESGIPNILRPYCLTIYDNNNVFFVEQTYCYQKIAAKQKCYFLYEDN